MDGTLLTDRMEITERTARCIREGLARGVRFVLATGRPFGSARPYALSLGLDLPIISYNGALVRDAVSGVQRGFRPIQRAAASEVAAYLEAGGFYTKVYAGDLLYVQEPTDETRWFAEAYGIQYRAVGSLPRFLAAGDLAEEPAMLVVHADPERVASLMGEVEGVEPGVCCYRPNAHAIDIVGAGTSKGRAVQDLAEGWGIPADRVLAVGNAGNDRDMLAFAGMGVAVANAQPDLLAMADWVTADNNSEGVAAALERFVL